MDPITKFPTLSTIFELKIWYRSRDLKNKALKLWELSRNQCSSELLPTDSSFIRTRPVCDLAPSITGKSWTLLIGASHFLEKLKTENLSKLQCQYSYHVVHMQLFAFIRMTVCVMTCLQEVHIVIKFKNKRNCQEG